MFFVKQNSFNLRAKSLWLWSRISRLSRDFFSFLRSRLGFAGGSVAGRQTELDKKLVYSLAKARIPSARQLKYLKNYLNTRELLLVRSCFAILLLSLLFLTGRFYFTHRELSPAAGGEYSEGVIGSAKYINPLYADLNDVDADLCRLVFSSLFKRGANGALENDLAEGLAVSQDGKVYTVKIRNDAHWHNGGDLTAEDVVFTFNALKDPSYHSPLRAAFAGDEAEQIDDYSLKFTLSEPYAAFKELLTFGILPAAVWQNVPANAAGLAELNLKPIGSGPYKFKSLVKDDKGVLKYYNFEPFAGYHGEQAKISKLQIVFFPSAEEALSGLTDHSIEGFGNLPREVEQQIVGKSFFNLYRVGGPQITAIFFNQKNNPFLADKNIRIALAGSLNKEEIISRTLADRVRMIDGPILPENFAYDPGMKKYGFQPAEAVALLEAGGWNAVEITKDDLAKAASEKDSKDAKTKERALAVLAVGEGKTRAKNGNFLNIKLTTVEAGDYPAVIEAIKNYWQNNLSIKVTTELIPQQNIQETIKSRAFQALVYGEVLTADPDVYGFWHTSKIGEGGLNLANYSSKAADKALETGRIISDQAERIKQYRLFQETITDDLPAIFLYSPFYNYVQAKKIKGFDGKLIISPGDRFANINRWYINTEKRLIW